MQCPSLEGRIKVAVEPKRLQSITEELESTASEPGKPTYHKTIEPILKGETGFHGCIKTRLLIVRWNVSIGAYKVIYLTSLK